MSKSHGYSGTSVYKLWGSIVKRCENPKTAQYKYYGGRGIKIDETWRYDAKAFCDWAMANGYSKGLEIDRIDNNGDYTPQNCHFVTHKENCGVNKRRLSIKNTTGERNICPTKSGTFEAWAFVGNRKQKFIGTYKTIRDAVIARDAVEKYIRIIGNIHDTPPEEE